MDTSHPPRVLAVTSGKGGVGKTNISVNLAIALAQSGYRVTLWDLDLGLANVDVILNLSVKVDLSDVLEGKRRLEEIIVEGPCGIRVIPGASGDDRLANLSPRELAFFAKGIDRLTGDADWIIIDTGAGISRSTLQFAATADEVLIVTTPEPTSMLDAYGTVKLLAREAPDCELHLVVNMARSAKEARNTLWRITASAESFIGNHLDEDGFILYDPVVGDAVRRRMPFLLMQPDGEAAASIRTIARLLDAHPPMSMQRRMHQHGNFLRRMLKQLGAKKP